METTSEVFAGAVRAGIEPGLRRLGFVGSRGCFELRDPEVWRLLGIQKAGGSSSSRVRFTVNVMIMDKSVWEEARTGFSKAPARPNPNNVYGQWGRPRRIGALLPGGVDHWWEVTARTSPERLAAGVLSAVEDYALPFLRGGTP
ncbi:DUF4304 domain-containing protein [Streptomyces sp. SID4985]|uniref:DUF4304 domain-containing protein n=1 Tax=Streptomyces sp. SID4985 TaxID=2690292 RepID=UPI001370FA80|nr:DUF4304 domain-containing protein [Streptomyces sp. SID4985]